MENYEKKYNEAIERMKSWARGEHPECFSEAQKTAEFIFPELKESESEDERIRTAIIRILKGETRYVSKEDTDRYIIWLENQGEFDDNIITRDDEILQAISVGLTDVVEDAGWSDFGGIPIEEIQNWLEKQPVNFTDIDIKTWKYVVDAVLTEENGIGQYLDSAHTEEIAKKLQKRFSNFKLEQLKQIVK